MGIIQGKAYWAKLDPNNPTQIYNTTANTDKQWTMDVTLDKAAAKILQQFDMSASLRDGSQEAVKAGVGRKLNGKPTLLGNGSIVNVKFNEWLNPATDKHVLYLNGVQVVHLVPYDRGDGFEVIEGGFKGEPMMTSTVTVSAYEEDFESVSL